MKIDLKYLKSILEVFANAKTLYITIEDIKKAGFDINSDHFIYHFLIIRDKKALVTDISQRTRETQNAYQALGGASVGINEYIQKLGLVVLLDSRDNTWHYFWLPSAPLRLSAYGYEFLESLRNK